MIALNLSAAFAGDTARRLTCTASVVLAAIGLWRSCRAQQAAPGDTIRLTAVLQRALDQHPLVEAALGGVRAAQGARLTARSFSNPVLTYQVESAGRPNQENMAFAMLPLEPLWQRWPRSRRADWWVLAAEAELTLARRQVALDAARAYYRVVVAQAAVATARDVVAGFDSLARFTAARVTEGLTAEGDLIRVQVEVDRAAMQHAIEEAELSRVRAGLVPFLGSPPAVETRAPVAADPTDDLSLVRAVRSLPSQAELRAGALTARPDVVAARARAHAARSEATHQKTLLLRELGVMIGVKRVDGTSAMMGGLSLPLPLFDQNRGEVRRAAGERTVAEHELEWAERRAVAEVEGAYRAATTLEAQVERLRGQFLARAEEAQRVALEAYREGAASLLQVIDATRTLAEARLGYQRTLFAWRESLLDLYAAAGLDPLAIAGAPQ